MKKVNPFKPHSPVPTAMFAGRFNEITAFEKGLHQTKYGSPSNFLITGERGIGKSSLLMLYKPLANGDIETEYGKFNFVTVNAVISPRTNLLTFIKVIERSLKREIGKIESVRSF
ncbi:ATP-binding protein, partial [Vibrio metschnikovii]|nr:ATP-binding protein [Vibrio metschnikovii]